MTGSVKPAKRASWVGIIAALGILNAAGGCDAGSKTGDGAGGHAGNRGAGAGGFAGVAGNIGEGGGRGGAAGEGGGTGGGTPAKIALLVDDDNSSNNDDPNFPFSYSDALFAFDLSLDKISYDVHIVPTGGDRSTPTAAQLEPYAALIWYTADVESGVFSAPQQSAVEEWLDRGNKTLIVFSENLLSDVGSGGTWTAPTANKFLTTYLGAAGWAADVDQAVGGQEVSLKSNRYVVDGAPGTPFADMHFMILDNTPIESTADVFNPVAGAVTLATVSADPTDSGANIPAPIVVAHTVGTSKVVYVGCTVENIEDSPANTELEFMHAVFESASLAH